MNRQRENIKITGSIQHLVFALAQAEHTISLRGNNTF